MVDLNKGEKEMLHHIIVKWNSNVDKKEMADKVRSMYAKADEISGVHRVESLCS